MKTFRHYPSQAQSSEDQGAEQKSKIGSGIPFDLPDIGFDLVQVTLDMFNVSFQLGNARFHTWILGTATGSRKLGRP